MSLAEAEKFLELRKVLIIVVFILFIIIIMINILSFFNLIFDLPLKPQYLPIITTNHSSPPTTPVGHAQRVTSLFAVNIVQQNIVWIVCLRCKRRGNVYIMRIHLGIVGMCGEKERERKRKKEKEREKKERNWEKFFFFLLILNFSENVSLL